MYAEPRFLMSLRIGAIAAIFTSGTWQFLSSSRTAFLPLRDEFLCKVSKYRSMTRAARGTAKSGNTNSRRSAIKLPIVSIPILGERCISSTAFVAEIETRDWRTRLRIDCGPDATVSGSGWHSSFINFGDENQV